ncbi:MAG: methyltransferase [bacterium]
MIALGCLIYISTLLSNRFFNRYGEKYYYFCTIARPLSLLFMWLGWSVFLSETPLKPNFHVEAGWVGWIIAIVSFAFFLLSAKTLGWRQSFLYRKLDDPVAKNSFYRILRHPQYLSTEGMILGIALARDSALGLLLLIFFVFLLDAAARLEDGDLENRKVPFLYFLPFLLLGLVGFFYISFCYFQLPLYLLSGALAGLTGGEIFQSFSMMIFIFLSCIFFIQVLYWSIKGNRKKLDLSAILFAVCIAGYMFVFIFIGGGRDAHNQGMYVMCRANETRIVESLNKYASKHRNKYPARLELLLVSHELTAIPVCPAAGRDTYTPGYKVSEDMKTFILGCAGKNHSFRRHGKKMFLPENYPMYDSAKGEMTSPASLYN